MKTLINRKMIAIQAFELHKLNKRFDEVKKKYECKKNELQRDIKKYLEKIDEDEIVFDEDETIQSVEGKAIKVKLVRRTKIDFNVNKLKEKLDKELLNEVIEKKYEINDIDELIIYLKTCGVNPKKFKSFLSITETVNQKKIDELSELGDITVEDLQGCYTATEQSSYIKISMKE